MIIINDKIKLIILLRVLLVVSMNVINQMEEILIDQNLLDLLFKIKSNYQKKKDLFIFKYIFIFSRIINRNTEFESETSLQKPHFRSKNLIDKKSPIESINNLLQTTRIQPININNLRQENPIQKNPNKFFQARSPTSWSIISDHDSPSPSNNKSTRTYRLILINEQQQQQQPSLDGRHVIPTNKYILIIVLTKISLFCSVLF